MQTAAPERRAAHAKAGAALERARRLVDDIEARLAVKLKPTAAAAVLAPLREALEGPLDELDPAALVPVFETVEDLLEAAG